MKRRNAERPNLPEGFKMTELGPLPEEWEVISLGQLADAGVLTMQNGFAEAGHSSAGGGVPHLRPFNVTTDGGIDLRQVKYVPRAAPDSIYWVRRGDIIFNNTNSEELVGKTAYFALAGDFLLSNHMTLIRVALASPLDAYWLANKLQHCYQTGVMHAASRRYVNQAAVTLTRLKGIKIPLPPLPEQRAIARVLRTVQRAKETTERVIAAARELKKSLMRHLFAYGPVPVDQADQVRLKETEIGPLPEGWKVVRLGEVADFINGFAFGPEHWGLSGKPIIRIQNLSGSSEKTNYFGGKLDSKYLVQKGDLLVSWSASLDAFIWNGGEAWVNQHIFKVDNYRPTIVKDFLYFALKVYIERIREKTRGSTMKHVTRKEFIATPIPLPPLPEQRAIADMLRAVDSKIEAEERRKAALDSLFKTLLHHLMTGKVRVVNENDVGATPCGRPGRDFGQTQRAGSRSAPRGWDESTGDAGGPDASTKWK